MDRLLSSDCSGSRRATARQIRQDPEGSSGTWSLASLRKARSIRARDGRSVERHPRAFCFGGAQDCSVCVGEICVGDGGCRLNTGTQRHGGHRERPICAVSRAAHGAVSSPGKKTIKNVLWMPGDLAHQGSPPCLCVSVSLCSLCLNLMAELVRLRAVLGFLTALSTWPPRRLRA